MTAPLIKFAPPSSVSVMPTGARLIGSLKVTSVLETAEFRGLGETAAIDVIVSDCTFVNEKEAGRPRQWSRR